jgi:hypothetical protein
MGRGLAIGDLDNDGRQDVLILAHNEPLAYLSNRSDAGHFVALCLESRTSNRDAIGARVTLVCGDRMRVAQCVGGGSFQSACDRRLHFGLGRNQSVQSIEVKWPSGTISRFHDLPADTGYLLREGADDAYPLKGYSRADRDAEK